MNTKIIISLFIMLAPLISLSQNQSVYNIKSKSLDKGNIQLADYTGKKIIITVFDAAEPDKAYLLSLDTLYRANKGKLTVIAIPVEDFHANADEKKLKKQLFSDWGISYPICAVSKAKKQHGNNQQELLQWLTRKEMNKKIDKDVQNDGEIFVLNEKGLLYARLTQKINVHNPFFLKILSQAVAIN
jgi:glutathione peroxidase